MTLPEYRLSQLARFDLFEIADYTFETWGEDQAYRYLDDLENASDGSPCLPELAVHAIASVPDTDALNMASTSSSIASINREFSSAESCMSECCRRGSCSKAPKLNRCLSLSSSLQLSDH